MEDVQISAQAISLSSPKFTAPILDTPKTIEVIPRRVIEAQGATSLRDVLRNSPGITFQAGEGGAAPGDNLYIRGFNARTDIFVDGVRDSGDFSRDLFNIEQVEVIKGPGSSYTGRGSTGGSVNQTTKKAQATSFVRANVEVGTAEHYRGSVDLNRELGSDGNSAIRVNLMGEDSGVAGRDEIFNRTVGAALAYTYGLKSPTQMALTYQHLEQNNLPSNGLWRDATTDSNYDWSRFYGLTKRDFEDISSDTVGLEITHEVSEDFSLRNYTRIGKNTRNAGVTSPRVTNDADGNPIAARRNDFKMQDRRNTILANQTDLFYDFGSDVMRHSLLAGIELSRETYDNYGKRMEVAAGEDPLLPTDLYAPSPNDPWNGTISRTGSYEKGVGKTIAGYLADRIEMGEHWELSGGLRWERFSAHVDDVDYDSDTDVTTRDELDQTVQLLSWNTGLVFKPVEAGSIYISYGTSFNPSAEGLTLRRTGRGGVPSLTGNPGLEPEENGSYELGTKWELLDQKLFVTAAVFRTVKKNAYEYDSNNDPVFAGDRTVEGIELSLSGNITPRWYVYGGFVSMDSKAESSQGDADVQLAYAPGQSFNLWTTFKIADKLTVGGGAQFTGDYYYSNTNDASSIPTQASYWLISGMVSYEVNERLSLRLNIDNVTDEQYIERGYRGHFSPGPGRSATLAAAFQF